MRQVLATLLAISCVFAAGRLALRQHPDVVAAEDDTPTAQATATSTPLPAPAVPAVRQIPEGNANNVDLAIPAANLWICEQGVCDGPGEGNLVVFVYATDVQTGDSNGDGVADGLGSFVFKHWEDYMALSWWFNPADAVFRSDPPEPYPSGADGIADGEGAARAQAACAGSLTFENVKTFGCFTTGPAAGPTGDLDLARLNLVVAPWAASEMFERSANAVMTVVQLDACKLRDTSGLPVTGSIGEFTPVCGELALTIRVLEGDVNLDCAVDVRDQQIMAYRYGSFAGSGPYELRYDLEPDVADGSIDMSDLQKVFGRDGSTCQLPVQPQPPLPPPAPFGN